MSLTFTMAWQLPAVASPNTWPPPLMPVPARLEPTFEPVQSYGSYPLLKLMEAGMGVIG
jgi:hypothetical protein